MRSLIDVNVLIALMDADHVSHRTAMDWFSDHAVHCWASCPITQNGCIRIMWHAGYPNSQSVAATVQRLRAATSHPVHQFWSDDASLLDDRCIDASRVHGPRQLTDVYLLALAVGHGGRLVTFDRTIATAAVRGATAQQLVLL